MHNRIFPLFFMLLVAVFRMPLAAQQNATPEVVVTLVSDSLSRLPLSSEVPAYAAFREGGKGADRRTSEEPSTASNGGISALKSLTEERTLPEVGGTLRDGSPRESRDNGEFVPGDGGEGHGSFRRYIAVRRHMALPHS